MRPSRERNLEGSIGGIELVRPPEHARMATVVLRVVRVEAQCLRVRRAGDVVPALALEDNPQVEVR
jgi:hypothetical protein